MNSYPEMPGWDVKVTLAGTCRHCGADLSGETRMRATPDWVARYYADEAFHRAINQSIARVATARHERVCRGQRIGQGAGQVIGERAGERVSEWASERVARRREAAWPVSA